MSFTSNYHCQHICLLFRSSTTSVKDWVPITTTGFEPRLSSTLSHVTAEKNRVEANLPSMLSRFARHMKVKLPENPKGLNFGSGSFRVYRSSRSQRSPTPGKISKNLFYWIWFHNCFLLDEKVNFQRPSLVSMRILINQVDQQNSHQNRSTRWGQHSTMISSLASNPAARVRIQAFSIVFKNYWHCWG